VEIKDRKSRLEERFVLEQRNEEKGVKRSTNGAWKISGTLLYA
jgi:hypothetical protein